MSVLFVAPRFDYELQDWLTAHVSGLPGAEIVIDRRVQPRRRHPSMREKDRRRLQRRDAMTLRMAALIIRRRDHAA